MEAVVWKEYGYIPPDEISYDQFRFLADLAIQRKEGAKPDPRDKLRRLIEKNK